MVLSYTQETNQSFKDRIAWWYAKLKNIRLKIWKDPWLDFMLCWMIFDAYLTEISQCEKDRDKLNYFYQHNTEFKKQILKNWQSLLGYVTSLKRLSPVKNMRPNSRQTVSLTNENNLDEVFNFIYQIRCNLFHGAKNVKNERDAELVRYGAKFLRCCIDVWMRGELK